MSVGTVDKIVEVLNRMCADRKSQSATRYQEHSAWLASEFQNIRELILYNPNTLTSENDRDSSEVRQKRKSPETSSEARNSPQLKRTSTDYAELAVAAGLPADLNKLNKQELLDALSALGNDTMTMKALKKDLVDTLKAVLLDSHLQKIPEPVNHLLPTKSVELAPAQEQEPAPNPMPVSGLFTAPASSPRPTPESRPSVASSPARKVSILSEARQHVQGVRASLLVEPTETAEERTARLAREYEARKSRHRDSQIRASTLNEGDQSRFRAGSADLSLPTPVAIPTPVVARSEQPTPTPSQTQTATPLSYTATSSIPAVTTTSILPPTSVPVTTNAAVTMHYANQCEDNKHDDEDEPPADGTWNEVPSPGVQAVPTATTTIASDVVPTIDCSEDEGVDMTSEKAGSGFKLSNLVGGGQLSFLSGSSTTNAAKAKEKKAVSNLHLLIYVCQSPYISNYFSGCYHI
jgi:hypothetical protein